MSLGGLGLGDKAKMGINGLKLGLGQTYFRIFPKLCPSCCDRDYSTFVPLAPHWVDCCNTCGLGRTMPPPRHRKHREIHEHIYSADRYAEEFLVQYAPYLDNAYSRGINLICQRKPRGRLLDVGCGFGYFLNFAGNRGFEAEGVELSDSLAKEGRRRFGVKIRTQTIEALLGESAKYDVITAWDSLEHFTDPIGSITIMREMISNDGLLLVRVPDFSFARRRLPQTTISRYLKWAYPLDVPQHAWHFSKESIEILMKKCGLEVVTSISSEQDEYTPKRGEEWPRVLAEMREDGLSCEMTVLCARA